MRVVTIIRVEGSSLEPRVVAIVEHEFDYRKPSDPVILMIGDDCTKGLFDFLIGSFRLSISLRVVGSRQS